VLLSVETGVGTLGVPVKVGDARGAYDPSRVVSAFRLNPDRAEFAVVAAAFAAVCAVFAADKAFDAVFCAVITSAVVGAPMFAGVNVTLPVPSGETPATFVTVPAPPPPPVGLTS
jgi:hypothetical protein